eukprot:scaffold1070_cov245-Pinguiococcus_pyrenoidosus.AAC.47
MIANHRGVSPKRLALSGFAPACRSTLPHAHWPLRIATPSGVSARRDPSGESSGAGPSSSPSISIGSFLRSAGRSGRSGRSSPVASCFALAGPLLM